MTVPLPVELRARIVAAVQEGMSWAEAAEVFRVGRASVNRYMRLMREKGSVEPRPHGGGQTHRIPDEALPVLRAVVEARPDATIAQIRDAYCAKTGSTVSNATVGRTVRDRLGMSLKKSLSSTRSRRANAFKKRGSSTANR